MNRTQMGRSSPLKGQANEICLSSEAVETSLQPLGTVKQPLKDATSVYNNIMTNGLTTPTKRMAPHDPVTPTANLKLLTQLAVLESTKSNTILEGAGDCEPPSSESSIVKPVSRKEKSLGLLCSKFLMQYPEYPEEGTRTTICLDEASRSLSVERRRIYDIVNVLESVHIMRKMAKNVYVWLGKTHLKMTLAKLKKVAEINKVGDRIENRLKCAMGEENMPVTDIGDFILGHKEKSLATMSQKFIMLFLVSKPKLVHLDLAAQILIGDVCCEDKKSTQYKTKIRRLYDIANILTSLQIIEKVHIAEVRGRKPAFQYTGPEVDDVNIELDSSTLDAFFDLSSPLSLTNGASQLGIKRSREESSTEASRKKMPRTQSDTFELRRRSNAAAATSALGSRTLTRHPSLQDVCQVAEMEREKLSSPATVSVTPRGSQLTVVKDVRKVFRLVPRKQLSTAILITSNGKPLKLVIPSSNCLQLPVQIVSTVPETREPTRLAIPAEASASIASAPATTQIPVTMKPSSSAEMQSQTVCKPHTSLQVESRSGPAEVDTPSQKMQPLDLTACRIPELQNQEAKEKTLVFQQNVSTSQQLPTSTMIIQATGHNDDTVLFVPSKNQAVVSDGQPTHYLQAASTSTFNLLAPLFQGVHGVTYLPVGSPVKEHSSQVIAIQKVPI